MKTDKIIYYDETLIRKVDGLKDFLGIEKKDYPIMHRYLIDNFGFLFKAFQYYSIQIAEGGTKDLEKADEEIRNELMRPLSYRQHEMIIRSFSK